MSDDDPALLVFRGTAYAERGYAILYVALALAILLGCVLVRLLDAT
ncbi:MAG: hypothetical protein ABI867_25220 [Kofleriaceae bacterium]